LIEIGVARFWRRFLKILTCVNEMAKIPKSDQSQKTSRKY
jgi:hypothetical protein